MQRERVCSWSEVAVATAAAAAADKHCLVLRSVGSEVEADGEMGRWEMTKDMLIDDWDLRAERDSQQTVTSYHYLFPQGNR